MQPSTPSEKRPSLLQASKVWWEIGLLSFGGPAAQIALMHRMTVEKNKWLSEKQFLNALNFCMLLPGPEAMQLATYSGWRLHGVLGGILAGLAFVLPGAVIILALAIFYALYGNVPIVNAIFLGIKAAVLAIVIEALIKVSKRALGSQVHYLIAALAFIGLFFLKLPYPLIVLTAALYGFLAARKETPKEAVPPLHPKAFQSTMKTALIWLTIWWLPIFLLWLSLPESILIDVATFFSKLAVVTFGGAYAVLAYMSQDVVEKFGWLTATQMMDGLGLAETTPGPLILVTEFVGFLAGFGSGNIWLGIAAALVTLWVTFVPCFLWVFVGSPYLEFLSAQPKLKGALSAITAAVVGVILNLSVWFALHVTFNQLQEIKFGPFSMLWPDWASFDWRVILLGIMSGVLIVGLRWNMLSVLGLSALGGLLFAGF